MAGSSINLSEIPPIIEMPAPLLGPHIRKTLKEVLKWDNDKIVNYGK